MQTFDQTLVQLALQGVITEQSALAAAQDPEAVGKELKGRRGVVKFAAVR
jgi:Tfp pilus assembly ATPase PilU